MKRVIVSFFLWLALSSSAFAFKCYFTLVKDSCWLNYDVKVNVIDTLSNKVLLTASIPRGKSWVREEFSCQPTQNLLYTATFSPIIWEKDTGKEYRALRYWTLPGDIKPGEKAWNIPVCYPAAFSEVPLPPEATGNCHCDFSQVPKLQPEAPGLTSQGPK